MFQPKTMPFLNNVLLFYVTIFFSSASLAEEPPWHNQRPTDIPLIEIVVTFLLSGTLHLKYTLNEIGERCWWYKLPLMHILATEKVLDSACIKILSWIIFDVTFIIHLDSCCSRYRYMQELCISKNVIRDTLNYVLYEKKWQMVFESTLKHWYLYNKH